MGCRVTSCEDGGPLRKGLCGRHYMRAWRGRLEQPVPPSRPLTRLMRQIRVTDTHWLWIGPTDRLGRGRFRVNGRETRADRYVWGLFNGGLPGVLRNVCGEPACVCPEPEHRRPA